jgi:Xaa-Pro aminopeptidase
MFQTFDAASSAKTSAPRVQRLRALMTGQGLDAFLVPRADAHQNEYVPASAERLKWLTNFSGSAGLAIIARRKAVLFIDGRYTVQARHEADGNIFELSSLPRVRVAEWLTGKLGEGQVVGFDPWLHTVREIDRLGATLGKKGIKLKPVRRNLVDAIWEDRPPEPTAPVVPHPTKFAGRPASAKIAEIQKRLKDDSHDAVVLTSPDSIAWAFNIRGSDVAHNPVALAFAIIPQSGKAELFILPEKITREATAHLESVAKISAPDNLAERISALRDAGKTVRLDPDTAAWWFKRALRKRVAYAPDPCIAPKAIKNPTEIKGARAAHVRDGLAMARFLAWLDREAGKGEIDEITAVRQLESFRRATNQLREISFDTISGSGANGAIVHYRVNASTNRKLQPGELFLVDSGAQYADGTTDITRTVAIGEPSDEMRERFTLVLKGHIGIATARFPRGTRGIELDPFARRPLWEHGLDFDHGTGHGVGSYLSVHEGPQSISRAGMTVLQPGMICSNEPGYYKEGAYGIRIENLVLVTPPEKIDGGDREMMGFETLTLAPIDRRLIAAELLLPAERAWLDAYHAQVRETLSPELDTDTRKWLSDATRPIGKS